MNISKSDYAKLKLLEENLWKTDFRFDVSKMDKVLALDFFEFGRSGKIYQRKDTLSINSQKIPCVFPLTDLNIRLLNENTAQVTYISVVNYLESKEKSLRSSIWSRLDNRWQLRFHQGTPLEIENNK